MTLTLIAALDEEGAIGRADGGLPWHVPDEATHFRAYCAGKWLLVGRRTFAEMVGWFQPAHRVIVLTRQPEEIESPDSGPPSVTTAATVPAAVALARLAAAPELVVIGGAQTYTQTLPHADRLVLTRLDLRSGGTIRFPNVTWSDWSLRHADADRRDRTTGIGFRIEYWERASSLCSHACYPR